MIAMIVIHGVIYINVLFMKELIYFPIGVGLELFIQLDISSLGQYINCQIATRRDHTKKYHL